LRNRGCREGSHVRGPWSAAERSPVQLEGITEFFGGVLLLAGFLTIIATIGLITDMAVAIATVSHAFSFFSVQKVGYGCAQAGAVLACDFSSPRHRLPEAALRAVLQEYSRRAA
jgi:hypothetical protein